MYSKKENIEIIYGRWMNAEGREHKGRQNHRLMMSNKNNLDFISCILKDFSGLFLHKKLS